MFQGDLSLHYLRWINANGNQVILELAFWIGPTPGTAPSAAFRAQYADSTHTAATDRWVVFHFHIDLDTRTFLPNADNWYLGVVTVGLYHGQDIVRPAAVTPGYPAEHVRWWQLQYWELANYNTRTQALSCNIGD